MKFKYQISDISQHTLGYIQVDNGDPSCDECVYFSEKVYSLLKLKQMFLSR